MSYRTPIEYVLTKLSERQDELKEFISRGSIADFNEYHKICGVIQGLDYAKTTLLDLAKRMEDEDE